MNKYIKITTDLSKTVHARNDILTLLEEEKQRNNKKLNLKLCTWQKGCSKNEGKIKDKQS